MTRGAPPRVVEVEVLESEAVQGRGARRTRWLVRRGEDWVRIGDVPGATSERRNVGPGTVWEHAVRVALPAGTELVCEQIAPKPEPPKDPLSYLRRERRDMPVRVTRTAFRVQKDGRLAKLR